MTKDPLQDSYDIGIKDKVQFDWPNVEFVLEKVAEELQELKQSLKEGRLAQAHELGDLLFTAVQVARHLDLNPSKALDVANQRYLNRFQTMKSLARKKELNFEKLNLDELEKLWKEAKKELKEVEIESLRLQFHD